MALVAFAACSSESGIVPNGVSDSGSRKAFSAADDVEANGNEGGTAGTSRSATATSRVGAAGTSDRVGAAGTGGRVGAVATGGRVGAANDGGTDSVGTEEGGAGGTESLPNGSSAVVSECRTDDGIASLNDADYAANCVLCAGDDRCIQCLCTDCTNQVRTCAQTPGCLDISECVQNAGCTGVDCYCGQYDPWKCAAGQADGPCRNVMMSAPSSRVPTATNPSAGPASDAAVAISTCLDSNANRCKAMCQ